MAPAHVQAISEYFAEIGARVRPAGFRVGLYGSGLIWGRMLDAGLADLAWLAAATGWSGHA
ncbi:MAG: hypothetical protein Q4G49_10220, partial [Paracoccus sp. (in: a-proteobacteria)]|nr:hypothetical protein [Paracoccus sp. (in: a-proteobacteria)]